MYSLIFGYILHIQELLYKELNVVVWIGVFKQFLRDTKSIDTDNQNSNMVKNTSSTTPTLFFHMISSFGWEWLFA